MKICLISSLYPLKVLGGAELAAERLAMNLSQKGHRVAVITTSNEFHKETRDKVKVYRLPLNIYFIADFHRNIM